MYISTKITQQQNAFQCRFRATVKKLPTEPNSELYTELLKTVLACDRAGPLLQKQVLDAYFIGDISSDMFCSNATELERIDSMVNLIVNYEYEDFYTANEIVTDQQRL